MVLASTCKIRRWESLISVLVQDNFNFDIFPGDRTKRAEYQARDSSAHQHKLEPHHLSPPQMFISPFPWEAIRRAIARPVILCMDRALVSTIC
jgi:hypothetical protein